MSTKPEDISSNDKIRRELLKTAGIGLILAPAAIAGFTHPVSGNPTTSNGEDFRGWAEKNIPANISFLDIHKGHNKWLTALLLRNKSYKQGATDFFAYLLRERDAIIENPGKKSSPNLFKTLWKAHSIVNKLFDENPHTDIPYSARSDPRERWHATVIIHVAGFNSFFEPQDIAQLGVPINDFKSVDSFYWNRHNGLARTLSPRMYGYKQSESPPIIGSEDPERDYYLHMQGGDGGIHFAHHLFLGESALYLHDFELLDLTRLPQGIIGPAKHLTGETTARGLSKLAGEGYELLSLLNWRDNLPGIATVPKEGIFEVGGMVERDRKANHHGVETAIQARQFILEGKSPLNAADQFRDKGIRHFRTLLASS